MLFACCFLAFLLTVFNADAQQKEWRHLTKLLQREADYFNGKSGFIQLSKSEYNTFTIKKPSVSDMIVVSSMWLKDRFGNEETSRCLEETIFLGEAINEDTILSAEVLYDYAFYFEDFPEA